MRLMKLFNVIFILFCLISLPFYGQDEELEVQLIELVNEYRLSKGLPELEQNEILTAVAFDQGEYILKVKKVTHEQEGAKKKTLKDRLLFYHGLFNEAGENASVIGIESKAILELGGIKELVEDESMALKAALTSWLNNEESRLNIEEKDFYSVGASVIVNEKNELTIVLVTASSSYVIPSAKKVPYDLYEIEEYSKEKCDRFLEEYPTLSQLFSDALSVEGSEVFLEYHNVGYLKSIIKGTKDKLAVELIRRDQFKCNEGNTLYPGDVANGYLLPPISKSALSYHDVDSTANGVKVRIGKAPSFYDPTTTELNLIFVKDDAACIKSEHNRVVTQKKCHIKNELAIEGITEEKEYSWKDSIVYAYYPIVENSWESLLIEQLEFLKELNLTEQKLEIGCKYVDLVDKTFADKVKQIAGKYNISNIEITDNETKFLSKLNGTFYQFDIEELDSETEKQIFVKDRIKTDEAFRELVDSAMEVRVTIQGRATISLAQEKEKRKTLYQKLYASGRKQAALFIQQNATNQLKKGEKVSLPVLPFDQTLEDLKLLNNTIVEAALTGKESYDGNTIHLAFLELFLIDKHDPIIRYNYLNTTINYWKTNSQSISNPELWLKDYKILLNTSSISKVQYARTLLNYYLLMTDYYYDQNKFDKRKKVLQQINKIYAGALLEKVELLSFVQFLAHQDQFQMAITILKTALKEKVVKSHLLYYLQIAQYGEEGIEDSVYLNWMGEASEKYPKELCSLFQNTQMGIQSLKNSSIKEVFCKTCQ